MGLSTATLQLLVRLKDDASSGLSSLGGALGNVGMIAGGAALAGVVALGAAIVGGTGDAQEARALYASTEQTIATMGNAAGRSAQEVVDLASSLSDAAGMSLFGDDQIQASSNLLLTFSEIKGETFDLATALSVDLAQALGGAPADQAMMLGKALNDPVKGMSALGKAGLTFSEEQKAVIAAMQASGDMAGAQAIIIEELNKQVGGQAQAAAQAAGGMVQFKASMGETFETIGGKLLPILDKFGAWLNSPAVKANIELLATALADEIGVSVAWLSDVAIPALMQAWTDMEPTVMSTIAFIESDVLPVLAWLADVVIAGAILQLQAMAWAWQNVLLPAIQVAIAFFVANVLPVLTTLFLALRDDLPRGIALAVAGWNSLKQSLSDFKVGYIDPIVRGWQAVSDGISVAYDWFGKIGGAIGSIQIPSWLQGHSPPPLADWFSSIGAAAESAGGAVGAVAPPGGALPSLPAFGAAGGAGGAGGGITINVTVQGNVTSERDLILAIRDGLAKLGSQNVTIFGAT